MPQFKKERFGSQPTRLTLTRKQIEQMYQMIDHFKDQNSFELCYDETEGKLTFNFTFEFDQK
jgi:hypothetical protein